MNNSVCIKLFNLEASCLWFFLIMYAIASDLCIKTYSLFYDIDTALFIQKQVS